MLLKTNNPTLLIEPYNAVHSITQTHQLGGGHLNNVNFSMHLGLAIQFCTPFWFGYTGP